jgi:deazaflavin-dependent oxidoreductase (nitroreductase family)
MTAPTGDDRNRELIAEFRANGGRVGDRPMLLLTTKGRRSGRFHTTPLVYLRNGGRLLVLASNYGAPHHPDWYRNLLAHADVHVEVGGEDYDATAVVADEPERERLFAAMAQQFPWLPNLQRQAQRKLPVVALVRAQGTT